MVVRSLIVFIFVALVFAPAGAQSSFPALLAEKPAPEHQDKLMLFGQFVGSWKFSGIEYHDDGSHPTDEGEIYFQWALQGRAIQDVWLETRRSDSSPKIYGTTLRFYDPETDSWRVTFIDPGLGIVNVMKARKIGAEIVIEGQSAGGVSMRWIFSDIKQDSFHWHGERLRGKRWRTYEELWAHRMRPFDL